MSNNKQGSALEVPVTSGASEQQPNNKYCGDLVLGYEMFFWFLAGLSYTAEIVGGAINDDHTVYISGGMLYLSLIAAAISQVSDHESRLKNDKGRILYGLIGLSLTPGLALGIVGSSQDKLAMRNSGVVLSFPAICTLLGLSLFAFERVRKALEDKTKAIILKMMASAVLLTGYSLLLVAAIENDDKKLFGVGAILYLAVTLMCPVTYCVTAGTKEFFAWLKTSFAKLAALNAPFLITGSVLMGLGIHSHKSSQTMAGGILIAPSLLLVPALLSKVFACFQSSQDSGTGSLRVPLVTRNVGEAAPASAAPALAAAKLASAAVPALAGATAPGGV